MLELIDALLRAAMAMRPGAMLATILIGGAIWAVPVIVADVRQHPDARAIFALDLLLGWTGIGWLIAFIWSLTGSPRST